MDILEERVAKIIPKKSAQDQIYIPSVADSEKMYGEIDIYAKEKSFASAKCCMCCH